MCEARDAAQHKGQRIGYAQVSSTEADLIGYAREGDTVVVSSTDRLARSVVDLNQIVGELVAKGVVVEFLNERVTFKPGAADPFAEFQLNIMASFAQLERAITKERQAEGIRAAKERGAYQGRARKLTAEHLATARELIDTGVPKAQVAHRLNVDRSTLYRALARQT